MHVLIMFIINFNPVSYFLCVIFSLSFCPPFSPMLYTTAKNTMTLYTVYLSSVHQLIRNRFPIGGKNLYKNYKNIAGRKTYEISCTYMYTVCLNEFLTGFLLATFNSSFLTA